MNKNWIRGRESGTSLRLEAKSKPTKRSSSRSSGSAEKVVCLTLGDLQLRKEEQKSAEAIVGGTDRRADTF